MAASNADPEVSFMPELTNSNLSNEQLGKLQSAFENQTADVIRGQYAEASEPILAAASSKKGKSKAASKTKAKAKPKPKARPKAKSKSQIV
jgi:hypothetical protein